MEKQATKSGMKDFISIIIYIAVVLLFSYVILTYVGQRTVVSGDSMYDTLEDGDNLIVDKLSYRFHEIERFDVIVFRFQGSNVHYIKRIIGLPGETVKIEDGTIYINGKVLDESYGYEKMIDSGIAKDEITLGDDEYFVLGDNRNDSKDSRDPSVGKIPRSYIDGKAFLRIYPFSKFGTIDK